MNSPTFKQLLKIRGLDTKAAQDAFLHPDYETLGDPLLLPDMKNALKRLVEAHTKKQKVVIYGDYDIDGLSATALLLKALTQFGFDIGTFIPNRFEEGYGLSSAAITTLAENGAQLIITVDCGSLSVEEIKHAKDLGVDVIVTDHHTLGEQLPAAVAVINPKRTDHTYPFTDFSGVGVAFNLVRALQTKLDGLESGQEKWLLDLVVLGTICDIVSLTSENRTLAYWGLKVLQNTRRLGLKALLAVAAVKPDEISARTLGFVLGPRLNASGRLETAEASLDLLTTDDPSQALELAQKLHEMNAQRRIEQNNIVTEAIVQAEQYKEEAVLVLSSKDWNHGIVGIVAAKILEKFSKPAFILQELGHEAKGSARSFGDFSAVEAIRASEKHILRGGGHTFAAGVTLETINIVKFRESVNEYHKSLKLKDQKTHLSPKAELTLDSFADVNEELINDIAQLEPFGYGNPAPLFLFENVTVVDVRKMGTSNQHVKLLLRDRQENKLWALAFSAPEHFFVNIGQAVHVWMTLDINEWRGNRTVEGKLLEIKAIEAA